MPQCPHETHEASEHSHCATKGQRADYLLITTLSVIGAALAVHIVAPPLPTAALDFSASITELLKKMWWGVALGAIAVGVMEKIPRQYFAHVLGRGDTFGGLLRAALAGVLLDLCSHGILMVGAKLYERGASLAQVMTFLISSPWNSFSLTLILIALIGLKWTLVFIAGSVFIAVTTGYLYLLLTRRGVIAQNPNAPEAPEAGFDIRADIMVRLKSFKPTPAFAAGIIADGLRQSRSVLRWLFLGTILAAMIHSFVDTHTLVQYFGPTLMGLLLTLVLTTIIEVCSEGSAPIGAELVNRAGAPGNGFAFLMAGVSTDYTEIMVLRQTTGSWKAALFLPLLTVPQIMALGWLMNGL